MSLLLELRLDWQAAAAGLLAPPLLQLVDERAYTYEPTQGHGSQFLPMPLPWRGHMVTTVRSGAFLLSQAPAWWGSRLGQLELFESDARGQLVGADDPNPWATLWFSRPIPTSGDSSLSRTPVPGGWTYLSPRDQSACAWAWESASREPDGGGAPLPTLLCCLEDGTLLRSPADLGRVEAGSEAAAEAMLGACRAGRARQLDTAYMSECGKMVRTGLRRAQLPASHGQPCSRAHASRAGVGVGSCAAGD